MASTQLLFFTFFATLSYCSGGPIVNTRYGAVEGFEATGRYGTEAEVFLAMPYAKPPVGELRFEKPQLPEPWTGVYQATAFRNDCSPHMRIAASFSKHSGEDCLTFNVVRPKNRTGLLPVLFWVHGGGYEVGSASGHGYHSFVDNYVQHGIMVVSIQYRLGFLGFFTDGTTDAPGNTGLFDEAAALKFVYDNIHSFGGNKHEITVWGYSAGAGSVSHYTLSPYTRDYVSKAIIMSGSAFAGWATGSTVVKHCTQLAKTVGCEGMHLKQCLKNKTLDELFDAVDIIGGTTDNIDLLKWAPTLDGDYIPAHPNQLVLEAPPKPTLIGLSKKEGNFFTVLNNLPMIHSFGMSSEDVMHMNDTTVIDFIRQRLLYEGRFGDNAERALELISDFYLNRDRPYNVNDTGFFVDRATQIFSDITFNVPVVREIRKKLAVGTPMWAYMFDHVNDNLFPDYVPEVARGSPHANEYHYLFDIPMIAPIDVNTGEERVVRDNIIGMVVSFVKSGVPMVDGMTWPRVRSDHINFLQFGRNYRLNTGLFSEQANFWDSMAREGFDVVDPTNAIASMCSVVPHQIHLEL